MCHIIYLSLSDLLHLVWSFLCPSTLLQISLLHSFLWLSNTTYVYTTSSVFIHLSMDILVAFISLILQIVLQWTLGYMYFFFKFLFSSFPNICLAVRLLDHIVTLFFCFLRKLGIVLYSCHANLHSHQQCRRVPFSPHSFQHLVLIDFLMMAILTCAKWHLIDIEHLCNAYWRILGRNIYLGLLSLFWLGCFFFYFEI